MLNSGENTGKNNIYIRRAWIILTSVEVDWSTQCQHPCTQDGPINWNRNRTYYLSFMGLLRICFGLHHWYSNWYQLASNTIVEIVIKTHVYRARTYVPLLSLSRLVYHNWPLPYRVRRCTTWNKPLVDSRFRVRLTDPSSQILDGVSSPMSRPRWRQTRNRAVGSLAIACW